MLHLRHALQQQCNPLGGSIDQKIRQEIKVVQVSPSNRAVACSFTHTYVVTRDALPISHVQTIHHSSRGSTAHRLRLRYDCTTQAGVTTENLIHLWSRWRSNRVRRVCVLSIILLANIKKTILLVEGRAFILLIALVWVNKKRTLIHVC